MNKELLMQLEKRTRDRLEDLKAQLGKSGLSIEELKTIKSEVTKLGEELKGITDEIAKLESGEEQPAEGQPAEGGAEKPAEQQPEEQRKEGEEMEEQRSAIMGAIGKALSTKHAQPTKRKESEIRSAFANFVVGKITEMEARALGIEAGNGSVTVPEVIASEVITYAQEQNLLRKYGTVVRTKGDVKYPVLVKKAEAQGHKKERADEMPETGIEFTEILLSPTEFDALATVTKKLLKMSGAPIEQIIIDELKKAYVRKEMQYMFNGDEVGNENPGALSKKAVGYYESETAPVNIDTAGWSQRLYMELVKLKNQPVTEVMRKSMWIVNRAALTLLEGMTDSTGRPLLHVDATDGVTYKLLGHKLDFTDAANGIDASAPVFYFGDFKSFHIQDVVGALELQKLTEKFAGTNRVGFQIYNLLDGQLIYSALEPTVYRYEVGGKKPSGGSGVAPTPQPPVVEYRALTSGDITKPTGVALTVSQDGTITNDAGFNEFSKGVPTVALLPKDTTEIIMELTGKQQWIVLGADESEKNVIAVGIGRLYNIANLNLDGNGSITKLRGSTLEKFGGAGHTPTVGTKYRVTNTSERIIAEYQDAQGVFQPWINFAKIGLSANTGAANGQPLDWYTPRLGFVCEISPGNEEPKIVGKKVEIKG